MSYHAAKSDWQAECAAHAGCYVCLLAIVLLVVFPPLAPFVAVLACCCCIFNRPAEAACRGLLSSLFPKGPKGAPLGLDGSSDDDSSGDSDGDTTVVTYPVYWNNKASTSDFDDRFDVSRRVKRHVQKMIDQTWKAVGTRDRRGEVPRGLAVVDVQRIEDSEMWIAYKKEQGKVISARGRCTPVHMLDGDPENGAVKTVLAASDTVFSDHDPTVNEFFFFHGTSPDGALNISNSGFRLDLAGSNAGTMFGKGAYFAESSSKADEYAKQGNGIYTGIYAMLLCRVTCGEMFRVLRAEPDACMEAVRAGKYDSVLGDREASVGTFREFVVYRQRQIYPEYVVLYKRVFEEEEEEDSDAEDAEAG
eukprot:TRINITY_DN4617_c0_g5_i1.p1 TRINITY_DN4617_c0_g5~~TRINITY_DN4617_c0_g5_i1.p1  ORF type:complete len:362 (-),score=62.08 TRINITY_DN4617_c0_g5_i1:92-1177(-)